MQKNIFKKTYPKIYAGKHIQESIYRKNIFRRGNVPKKIIYEKHPRKHFLEKDPKKALLRKHF